LELSSASAQVTVRVKNKGLRASRERQAG
jgi:hypothetical protein